MMFRRTGKNSLDDNEEGLITASYQKYATKKNDPQELAQRVFDSPQTRTMALDNHGEENWNNSKTSPLPHHFEGLINEEAPETTLGAGVTFRGELSFERFLRIDGSFEGELLSQGKVVVGPTGKVKANLNLREAIIEGIVEGNITVQEKLELRGEACVTGDIRAKSLCVDEGVSITGNLYVSPKETIVSEES
jgi:cytoskeletal protein CcmA (bactofilin family)